MIILFSEVCSCLNKNNKISESLKSVTIQYSKLNEKLLRIQSQEKKHFSSKGTQNHNKICKIISLRIIMKIPVNRKDKSLARTEFCHRYLRWKLPRILKVILDIFRKFISRDKTIFNVSSKITNNALIDAFIIIAGDIFRH